MIVNNRSSNPSDHFIVNNGIQSGDWRVQTARDALKAEMDLRLGKVQTFEIKKNN